MSSALLAGIVAGYGIAMPVGPIALLITEAGLRYGRRTALLAGAGAASADLLYAALAAAAGSIIVGFLGPAEAAIRFLAGLAVSIIGLVGLLRLRRTVIEARTTRERTLREGSKGEAPGSTIDLPPGDGAVYARFLGLTLLNPLTVGYFTALVIGSAPSENLLLGRLLFVAGVTAASASWQSLLAVVGSGLRRHLSLNLRFVTDMIGNLIVVVLGVKLLIAAAIA